MTKDTEKKTCDWCGKEIQKTALTLEGPEDHPFHQELCDHCCNRVFRIALDEYMARMKELSEWAQALKEARKRTRGESWTMMFISSQILFNRARSADPKKT